MKKIVFVFLLVIIAIQFIPRYQNNPGYILNKEISAPSNIMMMLRTSCYDCHSYETKWPTYSKIAPLSWFITQNVNEGRRALNFSLWKDYTKEEKQKKLKRIYQKVYSSMPLASYLLFHEEAKLNKKQREKIRTYTGVRR